MARIDRFTASASSSRVHPTTVECGYQVVRDADATYLQLSTYGSEDRESEPKVSQTLQLDRQRAAELIEIIRQTFAGL